VVVGLQVAGKPARLPTTPVLPRADQLRAVVIDAAEARRYGIAAKGPGLTGGGGCAVKPELDGA
jgi:hypothetical protein